MNDIQHDLEVKTEMAAKEAVNIGKKLFVFTADAGEELLQGAFNIATFIPKNIIEGMGEKLSKSPHHRGKQTIKQLVGSGAKIENIPINDKQAELFKGVARKYGIDYSLKRVTEGDKSQYYVFYKAKDINVLESAFKDFSAKVMKREENQSVKERIKERKAAERSQNRERTRNKKKKREVEL